MKYIFTLFLIWGTIQVVADNPTESYQKELEAICKIHTKKLKLTDTNKAEKYCKCWLENISTITTESQKVIIDMYQEKIPFEEYEDKNNTTAIFEQRVVENCLENSGWRRPPPEK